MIDIEKIKAAAMVDTYDEIQWSSTQILELVTRLGEAKADLIHSDSILIKIEALLKDVDYKGDYSEGVRVLRDRLEAAESELNVCSIEYGDVRDSYIYYKEKYEAAEKDAAKWHEYQAKKKVLADRGFGKSPMRDMKESEK